MIDLRCGDWRDVLADVETVDAVITDPPYSERTHAKQRHGRRDSRENTGYADGRITTRGLGYAHWSEDDVAAFVAAWSERCSGWLCAFTDSELYPAWRDVLRSAGRYVFAPLACVIPGMNVRLAGDGPSNWTTWLVVSRPRSLRHWGTLPGAYISKQGPRGQGFAKESYVVPGGKPLDLMRSVARDYTRPGDLVCDPCAGGGTTLLAAAIEGRRAVGAELDPVTFEKAQKRLSRGYTPTFDAFG